MTVLSKAPFSGALAALAVLAALAAIVVSPASASAAPTLKAEGVALKKNSKVLGSSSNLTLVTPGGTFGCASYILEAAVTENPGARLGNGTGSTSGCLIAGSVPTPITEIRFATKFEPGGTATGPIAFQMNLPGPTQCYFEGALNGSWTNGSFILTVKASTFTGKKLSGAGTCPASGTLTGTIGLQTKAGAAVTINE